MTGIRRHSALVTFAAFIVPTVTFVACSSSNDDASRLLGTTGPVHCVPGAVVRCLGPLNCVGEQSCLKSGTEYGPCICMSGGPPNGRGRTPSDASDDGATSNDGSDGATSNDASDGATSNDASDGATSNDGSDGATSNDASDDGPTSNGGPRPAPVRTSSVPASVDASDDAPR